MQINILDVRKSLNKAYLKVKPNRTQIETFKKNIIHLFDHIDESESEEFHKNIISEFLKDTYYSPTHYINTKGRADLVIHTGKNTDTSVGVLFETKKPGSRSEMPTTDNLNAKAFYELILYFLRERITNKNIDIKYLITTDIYEWFIFSSNDFEKLFTNDKSFVSQFIDFEEGRLAGNTTDFFYNKVAAPFVEKNESQITATYFDIREYESIFRNDDNQDDNRLIPLYKIFSPEHLLKLPFTNDSNSLDKSFYSELLHIIGLEESKAGNKKVIGRKKEGKRNQGSLLENAVTILKSEDCLSQIQTRSNFGNTTDEQLFNIALELSITWINRILFLKLLEGQLIKYNGNDKAFRFLNIENINDFDELNKLFFQVLAVKENERNNSIKQKFANVPYLNSSLFEPSEIEHKTIRISNLDDHAKLPLITNTVLKDKTGKKRTGEIEPLEYLLGFLDAYDFSSEGSEDIQEENKTLINASVLGLIFEKINGYKDGSFFTPGFITMYMCHETITRSIVQKFNESKGWECETIKDVYNRITDIAEANRIINSIKICDPAVGSGHFLVSALNEIIAIKSDLEILSDKEGKRLKNYNIEVINDELLITDEQGNFFEYDLKNKESQRIQESLFREKQLIIENCLFGVDINPNSVKICRLRLWIELLKNAYYKPGKSVKELETLPNIDINIKCGNSLISRYSLDADIKTALRSSKWTVDNYREAVMTYRNAQSKDEKHAMEELIKKIKSDFETEVALNDKRFLKLNKFKGDLVSLSAQTSLFELSKKEKDEWNKKVNKLTVEIKTLEEQIAEIKSNKIYENAFEWRFEFPEVLNNSGDFEGFDLVIGNPPYFIMTKQNMDNVLLSMLINEYSSIKKASSKNIFTLFIEKGITLLNRNANQSMIVPEGLFTTRSYTDCVNFLNSNGTTENITTIEGMVFDEANTGNVIFIFSKNSMRKTKRFHFNSNKELIVKEIEDLSLIQKINKSKSVVPLTEVCNLFKGMVVQDRKNYIFDEKEEGIENIFLLGNCISKWTIDKFKYANYNSLTIIGGTKSKEKHAISPRILIRRTGDYLCCAYLEKPALTESTLYSCWSKTSEFSNKYILALLHSKLFNYYIKKLMITNQQAFPQILMTDLESLPIMKISFEEQQVYISIVEEILEIKKSGSINDTEILETELDCLIYELYGLTNDEISSVENR
jgi:adenine-specific DNA-methyltransferase